MTEEGFWGALRAAGITKQARLTPSQYLGQNRDREVVPIPDTADWEPEQREVTAARLIENYGSTCH